MSAISVAIASYELDIYCLLGHRETDIKLEKARD